MLEMQSISFVVLLLVVLFAVVFSQTAPAPPRLSIPGAIPLPLKPQFRNEKIGRVRRPIAGARPPPPLNAIPVPITPRLLEEAKPVTEEAEEIPDNFLPQVSAQPISQQQQFEAINQQQQDSFPEEPRFQPQEQPRFQPQEQPRFQPQEQPRFQPQERPFPQQNSAQRFAPVASPERKVVRRPVHREPRPQFDQEAVQTARQVPTRAPRPVVQGDEVEYRRKPVAQILRKYREEHEDGSITWGFENDDGSFKEETIGVDCITRGHYGYVDPDGLKREYSYETGILCDPNKRGGEQELEQGGFVDYEGNKAILPNGVEVDLAAMGKKKSKRPGAFIQQPQQQQPLYRN